MELENKLMKQREIKFRAWAKGKFYGPYYLSELIKADYLDWKDDIVMMQYTGLKDKNGKEIYEGDIVRYIRKEGKEVKFGNCFINANEYSCWGFYLSDGDCDEIITDYPRDYEVIGNIYENPELLK
jgi:uncharacterized phage protein (TIGR01671 family)